MWLCNDCKNEFTEPKMRKTTFESEYGVSHLFPTSHECTIKECPVCGNDDIEELKECDQCGEWFKEDELKDTDGAINGGCGYLCSQCIQDGDIVFI
jgi:hypothetical protein